MFTSTSSTSPAFSPSLTLHTRRPYHSSNNRALDSLKRHNHHSILLPTRRRRPRSSSLITAVFIWSGHYEDSLPDDESNDDDADSSEHTDDIDDNSPDILGSKSQDDDGLWGDVWKKSRQEHSSQNSFSTSDNKPTNSLCDALRRHTSGPDDVDGLKALASESATDAFRRIVHGILGTLPGDAYEIVVTTDRSGIARLMQSSLATGYALRNAEFRLTLNEAMTDTFSNRTSTKTNSNDKDDDNISGDSITEYASGGMHDLFSSSSNTEGTTEPDYMRSVPKRGMADTSKVDGSVRWWDGEKQTYKEMSSHDYVRKLEAENELLKERLDATRIHDSNNNKLMDFMRTLSPDKIANLQANLSDDAVDAFKHIVKSVLGDLSASKVQMTYSTTRDYLGQVTVWSLMAGYALRNIEKRLEMTKTLENTSSPSSSYADAVGKDSVES